MSRLASGLIAGMAFGAVGAYFYLVGGAELGITPDVAVGSKRSARSAVVQSSEPTLSTAGRFSERSAVYQLAADADLASLRSLIEEAAAQPDSANRRFLLTTLLSRYAESAPREAIALADDLALDSTIVAALYASWASTEPAAALDAWSLVDEPRQAQAIGLALFQELGGNEQALSRVLTALPPNLDASLFHAEAIGLWAETAPEMALRKTLSLARSATRTKALQEVAEAWSERDPRAALSALASIEDLELRNTFQARVLRNWSSVEPESALEYVIGLGDTSQRGLRLASHALRGIAHSDPLHALELADRLPGAGARMVRQIVLQAWAADDVIGALTYVEELPTAQQRRQSQTMIARVYGAQDPEGALAWARNLEPRPRGVLEAVVGGIASTDPGRAVDTILTLDSEEAQLQAMSSIGMQAIYAGSPETLADTLTTLPDGKVKAQAMRTVVSNWASADPEAALTWLLANAEQADTQGFRHVAQRLGLADPAMAARYTSKVPPAMREEWIQQVARGYAQVDPAAALDWISQYQGEPAYEAGVSVMIQHSAENDPRGAARLLETLGNSPHAATAAKAVTLHWARSEPRAAASWAEELGEGQARSSAIAGVAVRWAGSDPRAAQRWVLDLPADSDRDVALVSLLPTIASKETPDATLLTAFSSDAARNQILPQVVFHVAQRDPDAARILIDEYISDAHTRQQAEQYLLYGQSNR